MSARSAGWVRADKAVRAPGEGSWEEHRVGRGLATEDSRRPLFGFDIAFIGFFSVPGHSSVDTPPAFVRVTPHFCGVSSDENGEFDH